jgi:hypothetical protein
MTEGEEQDQILACFKYRANMAKDIPLCLKTKAWALASEKEESNQGKYDAHKKVGER